jgi:structural maintenance of chromosome 1
MKEYRRLKEEAAKKMTQFSEEYDSIDRQQQVDQTNLEQEQRSQKDHMARIKQTELRIEELNGKIDKLGGYIADLEREFNEKQSNVQSLEKEVSEGRKRCSELEEELDRVNKEIGEARSDRNETSRAQRRAELIENLKQFPGVYGRLIDLCEPTHKRFQMAITKVLGRNMDSIVVERETTVQSCLRYMKEHRYEPETFLPLDYIKVTPVNEQLRELQEPKNVKLVLDVIKYDKQYYKALLYACGNALVCDNDDDARRLAYESGSQKNKVVSLNGTLFSKSGIISGGSSELKARAKRWDEKHLDALRVRKDKLFDEYKEQQKKKRREAELINARAQLQQLESRLRYSRTDKETAEKKQKILIDKDLVDFQEKLDAYEPKIKALQASINEREKRISKLRIQKNKIEDAIFADFCKQIHVANIRVYEDRELQAAEKRAQERLEFENQITQIQTMLEFERTRDTAGHVEQVQKELSTLEDALQKCQKNEKKYRKVIEDLQHEIGEIKDRLVDQKKKIEFQEREISDCTKRAAQLNKDYNEQRKRLQLIESDIEKLRLDRHNYFRTAKLNEISLPFRGNAGSMAAISLTETSLSDDINLPTTTDSSTNGDGNYSSQIESKQIYDTEDRFELNYKRLRDELKKINYEQVDKEEKVLIKQMADIETQLQKHLPQTSAIDARSREVKTTFELTNAEFERARNAAKRARQAFEKIKKERYDRFNSLYEHVSTCIDDIYKSLTNSQAAVACLTAEDAEEPYKGGITYNCVAPGKRFQAMENLSGGEKTVAAICLLFALRSFKPAPFFLLDEVDAALDNTNIGKVADFIREQSASEFQCIVISLKEQFYSRADALVGIYPEPGDCITSHCLTLDLNQFDERENVANTRG